MALPRVIAPAKLTYLVAGALVLAGSAAAAVMLAYSNSSNAAVSSKGPPVVYEPGADSAPSDYVPSFALSANGTSFSVTLRGVPEASVVIDELFRVRNVDSRAHTVMLSAPTVSNPSVLVYRVEFLDGATPAGTLDFKAASPSVTFQDLAPGKTLAAKVTLVLAPGAGAHNVADSRAITMAVSS